MRCRHCCKRPVSRTRGLCWSCFYTPAVRDLYPITSKYILGVQDIWHGHEDHEGEAPLPERPVAATPGSPEKVAVLEERARRGEALFHPHDRAAEG